MTTKFRTRNGSPDAPLWGQSFDTLRLYDAKAEYDENLPSKHSVFAANADNDTAEIVNQFINMCKAKGVKRIGEQGARELIVKVGMLLNEIDEAKR